MGRPIKKGLDYFPLDVDFFDDDKIALVSARFEEKGELIAIKLLCKIYKDNGYYYQWGEDEAKLFAKRVVGEASQYALVNDVVHDLVKRGFFDKSIFNSTKILTSKGIQTRYRKICVDCKRLYEIDPEICLLEGETSKLGGNPGKLGGNTEETPVNSGEKYTKKRKEKEIKIPPLSPTGGGGGDLFNSSKKDTPPPDGVKRNYEALVRNLTGLGVPPDDFNKICEITNFGETDTPIWTFFRAVKDGKIDMDGIKAPGKYIISILKNG